MREIKLLVVDDEERFLSSMTKFLSRQGCQVTTADNGFLALELLEKTDVDVMILDIKMPGLDGMATFREVKKNHPVIEVIMLTGHGTVDTALEAIQMGAFDYLMKPCASEELYEKIKDAADRKWIIDKRKRA